MVTGCTKRPDSSAGPMVCRARPMVRGRLDRLDRVPTTRYWRLPWNLGIAEIWAYAASADSPGFDFTSRQSG